MEAFEKRIKIEGRNKKQKEFTIWGGKISISLSTDFLFTFLIVMVDKS